MNFIKPPIPDPLKAIVAHHKIRGIKDIRNTGRMITAQGRLKGKTVQIKISGSRKMNRHLRYERDFYRKWKGWERKNESIVKVPSVIESGRIGSQEYFVREYVEGVFCGHDYKPRQRLSKRAIIGIVEAHKAFNAFTSTSRQKKAGSGWQGWGKSLLLALKKNKLKVPSKIEKLVRNAPRQEELSPIYGDLLPWHTILKDKEIYLIDGEMGGSLWPPFADMAWCLSAIAVPCRSVESAKRVYKAFWEAGLITNSIACKRAICVRALHGLATSFLTNETPASKKEAIEFAEWAALL